MKIKKSHTIIAVLILVLLVACSAQESGNRSNTAPKTSPSGQTSENRGGESNTNGGEANESGTYVTNGVTDDEILIGSLQPLSGPVAFMGEYVAGVEAYFNTINENGGIHGRKLKFLVYDDQYQPAKSVQLATRLVEQDKVFLVMGNTGTAPNLATQKYFEENKVVSLLIGTGAKSLTEGANPYYFGNNVGLYIIEGQILSDYAINKLNAKKIAVIFQNDDFGKEFLEGIRTSVKNNEGAEVVAEVPYVAGTSDYSTQVQRVKESQPDVIIAAAFETNAANIKKELNNQGVDITYMVPAMAGGTNQFKLVGEGWEGTISASVLINETVDPTNTDYRNYLQQMKKDFPNTSTGGVAQYGWASAQVLEEVLKRVGEDLTMDKFVQALYTLDKWDESMYAPISFGPENHYGITSFYITEAKDGNILSISEPIHYDPSTQKITYE